MKIEKQLEPFYKYLKLYYARITYSDLSIRIILNKDYTIVIRTNLSLAYENKLGVGIIQNEWFKEKVLKKHLFNNVFTTNLFIFDLYGKIKRSKINYAVQEIYKDELQELIKHIKNYFSPNSVKFIKDFL